MKVLCIAGTEKKRRRSGDDHDDDDDDGGDVCQWCDKLEYAEGGVDQRIHTQWVEKPCEDHREGRRGREREREREREDEERGTEKNKKDKQKNWQKKNWNVMEIEKFWQSAHTYTVNTVDWYELTFGR